jgi:hypothetical protein
MQKQIRKRKTRKKVPYGKVALLWANGKTVSEISEEMGWTKPKSKFPYSYAYGVLKKLRAGVELGLITVRINKKRQQTLSVRTDLGICPMCDK